MASDGPSIPETHVLAIASHVTSGYVGNTMATFCMQTLGCEVSAIHTVNYSSHVGYRRFKGRKSTASEVAELWAGLQAAQLDHFDMLLSGYCPSAELVEQIGVIARALRLRRASQPGGFFWVLDPVLGDNGQLYVAAETVPAYRALLPAADLILPNQFEAEQLSGRRISDLASLRAAVAALHREHRLPHVLLTSVRLPGAVGGAGAEGREGRGDSGEGMLAVVGSTATADHQPRLFRISVPALPVYFSGTGDMFAALLVSRLREAARDAGLLETAAWRSPDEVTSGADLPLARAAEKVLASMHAVLKDTARHYDAVVRKLDAEKAVELNEGVGKEAEAEKEVERHLRLTRAAEVRVVRNAGLLRDPPEVGSFRAQAVEVEVEGE